MTFGSIDVTIVSPDGPCTIPNLDTFGNTFEDGNLDSFTGSDLKDCYEFFVRDHNVVELAVAHSGMDGWLCEYFGIYFDDGHYLRCDDGQWIDNSEVHHLECYKPLENNTHIG